MKKSYYDNLGISPDASAGEIKQAYRRKAAETHPDKGGAAADFNDVAKAYQVLSDPDRRLLYDRTGKDEQKSTETEVQNTLLSLFRQVLLAEEDVEILGTVCGALEMGLDEAATAKKQLAAVIKKLEVKRKKVKSTAGVNFAHMVIDKEIQNIKSAIADLEHKEEIGNASLEVLKTYSEEKKEKVELSGQVFLTYFGAEAGYTKGNA